MLSKRNVAALIGAAAGVAIAHYDLLDFLKSPQELTRMAIKANAPGIHTVFESDAGLVKKQQLGIDDRYHAMLQLPFGFQSDTATVTVMLSETSQAFGISLGADVSDAILLTLMTIPDSTCDPTALSGDATLVLGNGEELNVHTDCISGDKGFARDFALDESQRKSVSQYLLSSEQPVIRFPQHGNIPFNMTGYADAVVAALAGPRVVPDDKTVDSSESNALVLK